MAFRKRSNRKQSRRPSGKSFWMRPPVFSITERQASTGTFSDIILTESDFESPAFGLNDTVKGSPVLERIICNIGFGQTINSDYFDPAGFGQVTMLVEAIIWTQTDQFVTHINSGAAFDDVLTNQRILGYGVMDFHPGMARSDASVRQTISLHKQFEPRSKVRLREKSIGVAIRTNFNLGDASSLANFAWVQPTMLLRQP